MKNRASCAGARTTRSTDVSLIPSSLFPSPRFQRLTRCWTAVDGKLIAVGVLDILPTCVSSVYLYYDPGYSDLHLGTISAMRETLLVRELQARGGPWSKMRWHLLGYYVHSCTKMKYKAEYRPAELLDQADGAWSDIRTIQPLLDQNVMYGWSQPNPRPGPTGAQSLENPNGPWLPSPPPIGFEDPKQLVSNPQTLMRVQCIELASRTRISLLSLFLRSKMAGIELFNLDPPKEEDMDVDDDKDDLDIGKAMAQTTRKVLDGVAALGPMAERMLICLV